MDRYERVEVFRDTMLRVKTDPALADRTLEMQAGQKLYLTGFIAVKKEEKSQEPDIEVTEDTTFHAAAVLDRSPEGGKVAVLNFANAYRPGGGVASGSGAQEECLCRCSNLYAGLTMPYFLVHYYKWNEKNTGKLGTDHLIYSPGVTVFKDDDCRPLAKEDWFTVDVITCAAPYIDPEQRKKPDPAALEAVFYTRWKNILEAAADNGADSLVLGAFGCGAFHNPPQLVASSIRSLLLEKSYGKYFRKIVFAIKRNDAENTNLKTFCEVFS